MSFICDFRNSITTILFMITFVLSLSYSSLACASEEESTYIKSFLGDNVATSDVYEFENGKPLRKTDNIRISVVNAPNNKVNMFALARIIDFANAIDLNVDFRTGQQANEVLLFDDFVDENDSFKAQTLQKYDLKLTDANISVPSNRRCFVIRRTTDGVIDNSLYIIDNKFDDSSIIDCISRSVTYSFGLKLSVLKGKSKVGDFIREFGPTILNRRDICLKINATKLDYSCLDN